MITEASPLHWPSGWQRTRSPKRSSFGVGNSKPSIARATDNLLRQLRIMGATAPVLSSNLRLKNDGTPYSNQREPDDRGIAVYFTYQGQQRVIACDSYDRCACNIFAIAKTVDAMRAIDRWGCSEILARAFTGFTALPQSASDSHHEAWWEVLGVDKTCSEATLKKAYRDLAKVYHPDIGGGNDYFQVVKESYETGMKHISRTADRQRHQY